MLNPYSVPNLQAVRRERSQQLEAACLAVRGPAIALISVAAVGAVFSLVGLGLELAILAIGALDRMEDPEMARVQLVVRTVWGLVMLANSGFLIWAGISMQGLRQHQLCWLAAILACIPAIGPCFCLGIPFGIWAITVLNRSEVSEAFDG